MQTANIHVFTVQQQPATITLQQSLASRASPDVLRAVAKWNERKSFDERRRKARARLKAQAAALVVVADDLEIVLAVASHNLREAA